MRCRWSQKKRSSAALLEARFINSVLAGTDAGVAEVARPGKTTTLKAAKESWDAAGFPVIGCARANTASAELIDAEISNATSIRRLLHRTDRLRSEGVMPLTRGTVIVVDEASMTSPLDLEALRFLVVEREGKLVVKLSTRPWPLPS